MARAWLINGRGIATKVKNATLYSNHQIKDLGTEANRECPNCKYVIDNSDVSLVWPGLPAGVKFDPTDVELLEHLAGKIGMRNFKAHIFIDEFIQTLGGDQGICYTHPENLPHVKKDGSSTHFFYTASNAYATGCKKRRKIHSQYSESEERVRWHKTGKTKAVIENGVQKGWKKIMVLYKSLGKGSKADKANWVMHQYHLGVDEEEKDGDLVVSKVFYQKHLKQADGGETDAILLELDNSIIRSSPRTPNTTAPKPPRSKMNFNGEVEESDPFLLPVQIQEEQPGDEPEPPPLSVVFLKDEVVSTPWWDGESQVIKKLDSDEIDESLLCHEVLYPFTSIEEASHQPHNPDIGESNVKKDLITDDGFPNLDDIDIDTPPDFHLSDLQFGSQDSILNWDNFLFSSGL